MDFDAENPLAIEIQQEMAASYFAACKKMTAAIEALHAFDRGCAASHMNKEEAERRAELLHFAAERVYFVLVQREAIKLSRPEEFLDAYAVPAEVRSELGRQRSG
jgi:hypothetical protein